MTQEELVKEVERLRVKIETNEKDCWDKVGTIGTMLGGVLVPVALTVAGLFFSRAISEQQIHSSREIAADNLRLGQYQLAAGLLKSLASPDAHERKQAIGFVFIVLPENEARRLVDVLSQSDPDADVRTSAANALSARLTELTTDAVSPDAQKRQFAASNLASVWRADPQITRRLLDAADKRSSDPRVQANAEIGRASCRERV